MGAKRKGDDGKNNPFACLPDYYNTSCNVYIGDAGYKADQC